jgi:uncharacterized protein
MRRGVRVLTLLVLSFPGGGVAQHPGAPALLPEATIVVLTEAGEHAVTVEIAETQAALRRGLRGRDGLPEDRGMLFLFDSDRTGGFWMHQVGIPLDIAFIDASGTIVRLMQMEPCRAPLAVLCPSYRPGVPYRMALEVNAGWFAARGIEVGDRISVRRDDPHREDPASP